MMLDFFSYYGAALGDLETEVKNRGNTDLCIVVGRTPDDDQGFVRVVVDESISELTGAQ